MDYKKWLAIEARAIGSDGCSVVNEFKQHCCHEHDLAYYWGRDPRVAFHIGWLDAPRVSRGQADNYFAACNADGVEGNGPVRGFVRWIGVRLGGWNAWRQYRKARP